MFTVVVRVDSFEDDLELLLVVGHIFGKLGKVQRLAAYHLSFRVRSVAAAIGTQIWIAVDE